MPLTKNDLKNDLKDLGLLFDAIGETSFLVADYIPSNQLISTMVKTSLTAYGAYDLADNRLKADKPGRKDYAFFAVADILASIYLIGLGAFGGLSALETLATVGGLYSKTLGEVLYQLGSER